MLLDLYCFLFVEFFRLQSIFRMDRSNSKLFRVYSAELYLLSKILWCLSLELIKRLLNLILYNRLFTSATSSI